MKYIDEIIRRYLDGELSDCEAIDNIERMTKREEYQKDVDYNRFLNTLSKYQGYSLSKSPEEVYLEKEKSEVIIHFLSWLQSVTEEDKWKLFRDFILSEKSVRKYAKKNKLNKNTFYSQVRTARNIMKEDLDYYNEKIFNLREYLNG
nr:MAG TPA: antitermination protein Q [Caudoviricetes sp.]